MIRLRIFLAFIIVLAIVRHFADPSKPNPNPDEPTPGPSGSIRVLIVEETSDRSKLPASQVSALTAGDVRDYLNTHCDKENGAATWRIYDKDQDVTNETQEWQDEFAVLKKEPMPTIAIKTGSRRLGSGWTKPQPLPKDTDSLLTLLKKYGGK